VGQGRDKRLFVGQGFYRKYMTTKEASAFIGVSKKTLENWRHQGRGPAFLKISHKLVKYQIDDIIQWANLFRRKTIDSEGIQ
jgi:transposase